MWAIGLDIGTTTLSAVALNAKGGRVGRCMTVDNDSCVAAEPWARLQDPARIWRRAEALLAELTSAFPGVRAIGLTGQMHGLLYTDERGEAASPLFTWQDGRGELAMPGGASYQASLTALTGRPCATGYGAVTHYYLMENGMLPPNAARAMTIHDYIGMKLTGRREPLTHSSDAASFGAPDWPPLAQYLRTTSDTALLGQTGSGIPVAVAIGDNQASFIGSVRDPRDSALVNMGTGGQVSVAVGGPCDWPGVEARPHVDGATLLVGASLCGGRSYALLESLFRQVAALGGAPDVPLYEAMNALADVPLVDPLRIRTTFQGTRRDPSLRGSIGNLSDRNFTAAHLVQGVLQGMVDELHEPYLRMSAHMERRPALLVGSGNAIRRNPALRRMFASTFGMELAIPAHSEEAAYGAALFALCAAGEYPSVQEAQAMIEYSC